MDKKGNTGKPTNGSKGETISSKQGQLLKGGDDFADDKFLKSLKNNQ